MSSINIIVDYYLTTKDVYSQNKLLRNLIEITNKENVSEIISKLENHQNSNEVETGMYLLEISRKKLKGIRNLVKNKLKKYKEKRSFKYLNNYKLAY